VKSPIRVLLADDQDLVRAGFRLILESEPGIEVVGEAVDGAQAVAATLALTPDVVCMDVQMPGTDGLIATRDIVASGVNTHVLVLTTFDSDDYLFQALAAGASGFLLKTAPPEMLVDAVKVLAQGDALLAPEVTRRVIERFMATSPPPRTDADIADLTLRERDVLALLARGWSNAEIAAHLHVGEATVKTHVSHVLVKLGVRDRIRLVVWAYEHGVVVPGD
jgi:DNA-binding NarL/FixJ family response regulator